MTNLELMRLEEMYYDRFSDVYEACSKEYDAYSCGLAVGQIMILGQLTNKDSMMVCFHLNLIRHYARLEFKGGASL